jgi:chromatin remodeling complex protein RSC6
VIHWGQKQADKQISKLKKTRSCCHYTKAFYLQLLDISAEIKNRFVTETKFSLTWLYHCCCCCCYIFYYYLLGCCYYYWDGNYPDLQDPTNKNIVNCDEKLKTVLLGRSQVQLFELPMIVKLHFPKVPKSW